MIKRKTVLDILEKKKKKEKIVSLTAYDCYHARILDEAGVDIILVGDSLGMVFAGHENTLPVTVDDLYYHASSVSRGVRSAFIVADMPFLSCQVDEKISVENCGRFIKNNIAQGVKIEGGTPAVCSLISRLVEIGIPVMGHIGLTPQRVQVLGGFKTQGKNKDDAGLLLQMAKNLEKAGVFCMVLEAIPQELAKQITETVSIPTIGIGAGPCCDGQILVISDILGMFDDFKPRFARQYASLGKDIRKAVQLYADDVKSSSFPDESESFQSKQSA
jgi:3-methyl-2-oxobutanoate hydroxymethyltransferase